MKLLVASSLLLMLQIGVPKAGLEGTVVRTGSTQPVQGARVTLTRFGRSDFAVTNDRGQFVFPELDEGSYTLQVQGNGYVPQIYGRRAATGPGTSVKLTSGQTTRGLVVGITPAASIGGRIRDSFDKPLVDTPVQLLRYGYDVNGQRTYQSVATVRTNDRGEYRIYWVTPGRYYLMAGRASAAADPILIMTELVMGAGNASGNRVPAVAGYTFYPGVIEIGNARAIELQPGMDLGGVDIALSPNSRTYHIRGRVIDSRSGQPPPMATVTVANKTAGLVPNPIENVMGGADGAEPNSNYDARTGTIDVRNLLPGTYQLAAQTRDPLARGNAKAVGTVLVTVGNADVEGVVIQMIPAVSIPGRLRVEGQLQPPMSIERLRVQLVPAAANNSAQELRLLTSPASTTNADGTFRLNDVLSGEYRVAVSGFPNSATQGTQSGATIAGNAYVKEARFEGADVLNSPLRFSGSVKGTLDVVVVVGGGQLSGVVTDARSQPVPVTRVVFVPDRSRFRADLYRTTFTNEEGRFSLSAVPPGDYKAFSWESLEEYAWFDPDVMARWESRGRSVRVSESATESIDVRLIPSEGTR